MCPPADYLRALGVEAERVVKVPQLLETKASK